MKVSINAYRIDDSSVVCTGIDATFMNESAGTIYGTWSIPIPSSVQSANDIYNYILQLCTEFIGNSYAPLSDWV